MASPIVRLGDRGTLEVVRAAPPEAPDRLRATIGRLRAVAGAGAVDVRSVTDDGDRVELVLAHAGRSLSPPIAASEVAHVGAALAANLADMHARGLVHGAISVDHVLVDGDGVVRVCGFGGGGGLVATAADDVLAIGALVRELLDDADTSAAASAVRGIADRCRVHDPSGRPTMAAIAASLSSCQASRRTIAPPVPLDAPRRRWPVMAGVLVIVAALAAVVAWPIRAGRPTSTRAAPAASSSPSSTSSSVLRPSRIWPAIPHTIVADGRWSFGTESDLAVLVGDWDCNGVDTPAVLQRGGDLFVVDEWRDNARGRFIATIEGASSAAVERDRHCDVIVVILSNGEIVRPALGEA